MRTVPKTRKFPTFATYGLASLLAASVLFATYNTYNQGFSDEPSPVNPNGNPTTENVPLGSAPPEPKHSVSAESTWSTNRKAEPKTPEGIVLHDVPFTSQAPFGNWGDQMYQEGCEEASVMMALAWVKGTAITPEEADLQIKEISRYEDRVFWTHIHTSVDDTGAILSRYFWFKDFEIVRNMTKTGIIDELEKGHIVIVPTAGRELGNLFYTPPGPLNHMLVVIGYDETKKQFITNDSGTKNGKGYRYDEDTFYGAIWNYPTSATDEGASADKSDKSAIVVRKAVITD